VAAAAPAAGGAPSATTSRAPKAPGRYQSYKAPASFEQAGADATGVGRPTSHPPSTSYVDLGALITQGGGGADPRIDPRAVALMST